MRNKTSTVIGLAIATILTTYMSALTLSNQAFAQHSGSTVVQAGMLAGQGTTSPVIIPWHSIQTNLPDIIHSKQFGITKPPKIVIKRGLGCSPWDPC